jgi:hypothetical protein
MDLTYDPNVIYGPASTWTEPFSSHDRDRIIWNAHRPIPGTTAWEGRSRWGTWYATAKPTDANYDYFLAQAKALDAREIVVVNNAQVLALAEQARILKGSTYGLAAYVAAMDSPAEAAAEFVASLNLPWTKEGDTSADELLKEYDA